MGGGQQGGFGQQPMNNSFGGGQMGYGQRQQPMGQSPMSGGYGMGGANPGMGGMGGFSGNQGPQMGGFGGGFGQSPQMGGFGRPPQMGGFNQSPQMGGFNQQQMGGFGGGFGGGYNPIGDMGQMNRGFNQQQMGGFGGGFGGQMAGNERFAQMGQQANMHPAFQGFPSPERMAQMRDQQQGQRQMGDAQPQNQFSGMNPMQGAQMMMQRFGQPSGMGGNLQPRFGLPSGEAALQGQTNSTPMSFGSQGGQGGMGLLGTQQALRQGETGLSAMQAGMPRQGVMSQAGMQGQMGMGGMQGGMGGGFNQQGGQGLQGQMNSMSSILRGMPMGNAQQLGPGQSPPSQDATYNQFMQQQSQDAAAMQANRGMGQAGMQGQMQQGGFGGQGIPEYARSYLNRFQGMF
jgi:hypothetical protein